MKLYIKEHIFTWGDKFSVRDAQGEEKYSVQGEVFTWGKKLHVYDRFGREAAFIRQKITLGMPRFVVEVNGREVAEIKREFTWFVPKYYVYGLDWDVQGEFFAHEYVVSKAGRAIVTISREWMTWGDSYELDIADGADELVALAVVLAIDCVVESSNNT